MFRKLVVCFYKNTGASMLWCTFARLMALVDFGGNVYFSFSLTSLAEIPANLLATDNCER